MLDTIVEVPVQTTHPFLQIIDGAKDLVAGLERVRDTGGNETEVVLSEEYVIQRLKDETRVIFKGRVFYYRNKDNKKVVSIPRSEDRALTDIKVQDFLTRNGAKYGYGVGHSSFYYSQLPHLPVILEAGGSEGEMSGLIREISERCDGTPVQEVYKPR